MNNFMKVVLLICMVFYIVSPVDLLPGPIDDSIVFLLWLAYNKKISIKGE